jgi:hypothetical protein
VEVAQPAGMSQPILEVPHLRLKIPTLGKGSLYPFTLAETACGISERVIKQAHGLDVQKTSGILSVHPRTKTKSFLSKPSAKKSVEF